MSEAERGIMRRGIRRTKAWWHLMLELTFVSERQNAAVGRHCKLEMSFGGRVKPLLILS